MEAFKGGGSKVKKSGKLKHPLDGSKTAHMVTDTSSGLQKPGQTAQLGRSSQFFASGGKTTMFRGNKSVAQTPGQTAQNNGHGSKS